MDFYGEHMEDVWLHVHGQMPERGVYVAVGCYHPQIASNSAHWRDIGWTGLAIDGNPNLAAVWEKYPQAKFVCATVGAETQTGRLVVHPETPGWSKVEHGEGLPALRTLESIVTEHGIGKIDLLSLDLEGMEEDALLTLDLDKHTPTIIISEYDTQGIGKDFRVLEHLIKNDYVALHMTAANIIFKRANKQKLSWGQK